MFFMIASVIGWSARLFHWRTTTVASRRVILVGRQRRLAHIEMKHIERTMVTASNLFMFILLEGEGRSKVGNLNGS